MTFAVDRLTDRVAKFQDKLKALRARMATERTAMAAGPFRADLVIDLSSQTNSALNVVDIAITEDAVDDTLQTIFREQYKNATFDLTVELAALRTAIVGVLDEIDTRLPASSPGGFVEEKTLTRGPASELTYVVRTFSIANTATLRTELDAVIALIDP